MLNSYFINGLHDWISPIIRWYDTYTKCSKSTFTKRNFTWVVMILCKRCLWCLWQILSLPYKNSETPWEIFRTLHTPLRAETHHPKTLYHPQLPPKGTSAIKKLLKKHRHRRNVTSHHSFSLLWQFQLLSQDTFYHKKTSYTSSSSWSAFMLENRIR